MHQCQRCLRLIHLAVALLGIHLATGQSAFAQPGIREALLRLDKNEDGQISPDEITARARPYFERITDRQSRSWREKPISIERLQNIIRVYYSRRTGSWRATPAARWAGCSPSRGAAACAHEAVCVLSEPENNS